MLSPKTLEKILIRAKPYGLVFRYNHNAKKNGKRYRYIFISKDRGVLGLDYLCDIWTYFDQLDSGEVNVKYSDS